jgi:hypothetical protein
MLTLAKSARLMKVRSSPKADSHNLRDEREATCLYADLHLFSVGIKRNRS